MPEVKGVSARRENPVDMVLSLPHNSHGLVNRDTNVKREEGVGASIEG